jgi:hypothetical protein
MTEQTSKQIGVAWMDEDRAIHLRLRAELGATVGDSFMTYPPDHPDYQEILTHLNGLDPGQYKTVSAWPEPRSATHADE